MLAALFQLLIGILAFLGVVKVIEELMKTRQLRKLMRTEGWRTWRRLRRDALRNRWSLKIQGLIQKVFKVRFIQFLAYFFEKDDYYIFKTIQLPSLGRPGDTEQPGSLTLKILFYDWINDNDNFNWIQVTSFSAIRCYHLHKEITHDDYGFLRFRIHERGRSAMPESVRAGILRRSAALSGLEIIDLSTPSD